MSQEKRKDEDEKRKKLDELFQDPRLKEDVSKLKEILLQGGDTKEVLKQYEGDYSGKQVEIIKSILRNPQLRLILKQQKNEEDEKRKKLDELFQDPRLKEDVSKLKEILLQGGDTKEVLKQYEGDYSGKQVEIIKSILRNPQLRLILKQQKNEEDEKRKKLDELFQDPRLKEDVSKLKEILLQGGDTKEVLKQYEGDYSGKQVEIIKSILRNPQLRLILKQQENEEDEKRKKLDELFQDPRLKEDVSKLKEILLQGGDTKEVLKQYEEDYSRKQVEIIKSILRKSELSSIIPRSPSIFDAFFLQQSLLLDQLFSTSLHLKRLPLVKSLIFDKNLTFDQINTHLGELSDITVKQSQQLSQMFQNQSFKTLQQKVRKKIGLKLRKKQLEQLFSRFGICFNVSQLVSALSISQSALQIIQKYEDQLTKNQILLVKTVLNSKQMKEIMGWPEGFIDKIIFLNNLFEQNQINEKLYKLKEALVNEQNCENILKHYQSRLKSKQYQKIQKLLKSQELRYGLIKLSVVNYEQKYAELLHFFYPITKNKQKLAQTILLGCDTKQILKKIIEQQNYQNFINLQEIILSEKLGNFLKANNIPPLIFVPKVQIKIKNKIVLMDKGLKIFDVMKLLQLNDDYRLLTQDGELADEDSELIQPLDTIKCTYFTVNFQNKTFQFSLPLISIKKVKPLLQKLLNTNLSFQVQVQRKEKYEAVCEDYIIQQHQNRLYINYYVKLLLKIDQDQKEREFIVLSSQRIKQIQQKIQLEIGLKKQNQKWYIEGEQVLDLSKTIEKLQIQSDIYRIYIQQMKTLQFYGFNTKNLSEKIRRNTYKDFFIQDDDEFIDLIKKSDFPKVSYSEVFRNLSLGYIFSAIKKHCLIDSSLKHIQGLVEKTQKEQSLWKPLSSKEKCYFNDTYVLYHILKSSSTDLRIDILRGLMNNTPIPLTLYDHDGKLQYLYSQNYWIQNKAYNICSLGLGKVSGKSSFLNIVFQTNFSNHNNIHKQCQGGMQIQYNIFQSDQYYVNIVDISNDIEEQTRIQIAKACNLLIIHSTQQLAIAINWLKQNGINIPYIFVQRDVEKAFDQEKRLERAEQKKQNQLNMKQNKYKTVHLTQQAVKHYNTQVNQIANGIQQFIRKNYLQQSKQNEQFWKFTDFLASKTEKNFKQFNQILKQIQRSDQDLSFVTNYFNEYKIIQFDTNAGNQKQNIPKMDSIKAKAIQRGLATSIKKIIKFYRINFDLSSQIMTKLRIYLTLLRNELFKDFNCLQSIIKRSENTQGFQQAKKELLSKIQNISKLKGTLITGKVKEAANQFVKGFETFKNSKDWEHIIKVIKTEFEFQIQPKAFSVENFWREVIYMGKFNPNYEFTIEGQHIQLYDSIINLGRKEVQDSQNFQFINGDLLEMPTQYLTKIFENQHDKKVMVVAIFGPQSSGKSTLLNFVLGCDFMSSAGRCTKGIYGTYFEISNRQIPNCQAILVLDTEGLFSNYQNARFSNRKGFDNKLVLFCLQVCDIIILNTKGDVTKDCQQILQLAFDSQIIDPKNLPQIYFVLNLNGGQINSTQSRQIQKFCDTIITTNEQSKKVMKHNQAVGMPMAFNQIPRKSTADFITKFLKPKTLPSDRFYKQTKKLCFEIMDLITQRGRQRTGRTLQESFVKMDQTWSTINKYPILTRHGNKNLKKLEQEMKKWKLQKIQDFFLKIEKNIQNQGSKKLMAEINEWEEKKGKEIELQIEKVINEFQSKFPTKPGELSSNNLIRQMLMDLQSRFKGVLIQLKQFVKQRRMKLQIDQADSKGFDSINFQAKQIKQQTLKTKKQFTKEQKIKRFQKCWDQRQKQMEVKLDRKKSSKQTYSTMIEVYNNLLQQKKFIKGEEKQKFKKRQNSIIQIKEDSLFLSHIHLSQEEFEYKLQEKFKKQFSFKNVFQSSDEPPVMNIEKKLGDLSFQYLDMSKYFQQKKCPVHISIDCEELKSAIDFQYIKKDTQNSFNSQPIFIKILQDLHSDFCKIGIQYNRQKLKQVIQNQFQFSLLKFWTWGGKRQLKQSDISKTFKSQYKEKNKTYDYYLASKWMSSILEMKEDKISQESLQQFKILSQITKQKLSEFIQPNDEKIFYSFYTVTKIVTKIGNYLIKKQIQKFKDQQEMNLSKQIEQAKIRSALEKDLRQINIRPQWNGKILESKTLNNFVIFDTIEKNKIFGDLKELKRIFQSFSKFWNFSKVQNLLKRKIHKTNYNNQKQIQIGYFQQIQISIIPQYQGHQILKKYINKQYNQFLTEMKRSDFTKFINKELKYENALIQIKQQSIRQKIGEKDLKLSVSTMINIVNKVVQKLNKDLKQVSQRLIYDFIAQLHFFSFHLLWKIKDTNDWGRKQNILNQFKSKKPKQLQIFLAMVSGNPGLQNSACVNRVIELYKQFINRKISLDKNQFLAKQRKKYKEKYSRQKVQVIIDKNLFDDKTGENQIFQYLINPTQYTEKFYQNLEQQQSSSLVYIYSQHTPMIRELFQCITQLRDNCGSQEKNNADDVFEGERGSNKNIHFLPLLIQVLLRQKQKGYVGADNNIGLKIKAGYMFSIKQLLKHQNNREFVKQLKHKTLQITNLKLFLDQFSMQLNNLLKSLEGLNIQLNNQQLKKFKNSLNVQICKQACPCCRRNCDVDMQLDTNHKIHKCNSGHQMRAIGGMRLKYLDKEVQKYKASIQRCQDISPDSQFQFNGKPTKWSNFKLEKKEEWDFEFINKNKNQVQFKRYWQRAGRKVCDHYKKKDNIQMEYVSYTTEEISKQTRVQASIRPTNYIFALDDSGSMSGTPWTQLKQSMKKNIYQISHLNAIPQNQYISIFKFDHEVTPVCEYENPQKFNLERITFGGGGTIFTPAFNKAYQIMKRNQNVDNVFIFISDGQAEYPQLPIQNIKKFKSDQKAKNLNVDYVSILIGSGASIMDKIKTELQGRHNTVTNASLVTNLFKEVMMQKRN